MTPDQLVKWQKRNFPNQQLAADALDCAIRQFRDYQNHIAPIPLKIELACVAIELGFMSWEDYLTQKAAKNQGIDTEAAKT